ncbi:14129_t:CDS:2 [Acaulospora morrowiae]|uniref:14129_t:CDS:1 n=1 Tax=Acaulospora morrowiae TaxID=94023 RepID=A0A9N9FEC2_9GLOM|nr:14129_t:CDS:2 [Acaulospora morrowiae]
MWRGKGSVRLFVIQNCSLSHKSKGQANSKRDEADVFFHPSQTECNDKDNSRKLSMYDYEKYKKTTLNWIIPINGYSQPEPLWKTLFIISAYVVNMNSNLAHSFILDPDDDTYLKENVFTESELREIRHFQVKKTPLMPPDLTKYLNSFNLETASEIRKQIFSPDQMDQDFNRSRDFDRDRIRNTIYNLLLEYESNTLTTDHLELEILVHVWGFTDKIFNDIEKMKLVRGDSCSLSSDIELDDMIIRKITAEFGCAEAGLQFEDENDTKLLRERGLKMPKMMKDMFKHLCETFNQDDHKTRQLETIGILHAGLMMVLLRLDSPAGYVCRVLQSKSFSIATNIKEFVKTFPLISLTWKAKKIVENMISLIEQTNETDESSEEDQLRRLQDVYDITPLPSRK